MKQLTLSLKIEGNFNEVDGWAKTIIIGKKKIVVQCIACLLPDAATFQLYQNQKETCNKHSSNLEMKKTEMNFTKILGFITGKIVNLASLK